MDIHRMKIFTFMALPLLAALVLAAEGGPARAGGKAYDLVIVNGRVMDPETGRNEVAAVAIKDGVIKKITSDPRFGATSARRVIDAKGLVVCPGFINTHTHEAMDIDDEANISPVSMVMVHDGITFWLGGNCGMAPTGMKVALADGTSIQVGDPFRPLGDFLDEAERVPLYSNYGTLSGNITLRSQMGLKHMEHETDDQIEKMKAILAREMEAGSFGISSGLMYDMGASKKAMLELARVSKKAGGMAASHTRYPTWNLKHLTFGIDNVVLKRSITEAIETCRQTRIPFIVSHITDMAQSGSNRWNFETLDKAIRVEGLPLAGDIIGHDYLYNDFFILTFKGKIPTWFMLGLGNYDVGQFYAGQDVYIDGELYVEKYGQLNLKQAEYIRRNVRRIDGFGEEETGLALICKIIPPEDTKLGLQYPWAFIGNDYGGKSVDPDTGELAPGNPRGLGTFSRLLGHWSREEGAISLEKAVFKATIAPAMWLGLEKKGRLQEGCDADIVVFDPDTVIDRSEWLGYKEALKPEGIIHVIVNGRAVIENKELTGARPGRLVRRTWEVPGDTAALIALYEERFGHAE